jgi:regulator of protease activity HflC (stomatin/prohibitin superfamily)
MKLEERIRAVTAEKPFSAIVVKSKYVGMRADQLRDTIVKDYNNNPNITAHGHREPIIINAGARVGERVDPGCFVVAHRNRICEMRAGTGERFALQMVAGYTEVAYVGRKDGIFRQNEALIGDFGSYVINVPQSKFAKVWSGNQPYLLGEGIHVIHDPLFKTDSMNFLIDEVQAFIQHGNLRIIRVPVGQFAKVTVNTQALLLPYRTEPYIFDTPQFDYAKTVSQSERYVSHGPLHLLQVPAGSVALCWQGSKALILEFREEPYFFDDPLFKFVEMKTAQSKMITHGSINRIRPGVNGDLERAVVQHDGEIEFIERFTTIDNPNHAVLGFLNMGLQTCIFPSKETRAERLKDNPRATSDEVNYEPMTTRDSLKMGMKLLVAFQVKDPHVVLRKLRLADIIPHVENLCVSDMVRAVQHTTSGNFLNANRTSKQNAYLDRIDSPAAAAAQAEENAQDHVVDMVRDELRRHLVECGLELVRFNVEEAKVLDEEISREMSRQSLVAATANAEQAVIKQKTAIAQSHAELEAMARRVQQDQENKIRISAAEAELQAARLKAQAVVVQAEAAAKSAEMEGEVLMKYPALLQLRLAELQARALSGSNLSIVSPGLEMSPYFFQNAGMLGMKPQQQQPKQQQ